MKRIVIVLSGLLFLFGCGSSSKPVSVSLTPSAQTSIDQGQTLNFTASVGHDSKSAGVTWSMSGTGCTGSGCGTFTGGTTSVATYNAPASVTAKMTVTIVATSISDKTKSASSTIAVNTAPTISSTQLAGGTVGTAYSAIVQASGGVGTLNFALASGSSLPAGLSISNTGAISGTPTASGTTNFTVKVTDQSAAQQGPVSATQQFSITIAPPAISVSISPASPTSIDEAQTLNFTAKLANDSTNAGVTWSTSGVAGSGTPCGTLTNTTPSAATYNAPASVSSNMTVAVTATSIADTTKSMASTIVVAPAPSITTTTLSNGTAGMAYSATLQANFGSGTLTWSLAPSSSAPGSRRAAAPRRSTANVSSLPVGLSLSSAGVISGTPTAAGTTSFTVQVTDTSQGQQGPVSATQQLSITIEGSQLSITTTSLPNGNVGTAYSAPLQASGETAPYTWSVTSGSSLPTWLSLTNSAGNWTLSGTPTASGSPTFSLTVTDSSSPQQSQTQAFSLTINAAAACSDSGSESLLAGQYAFILGGYTESGFLAAIGSFTADGTGKIIAGTIDSNGTIVQSAAAIDTTKSFYNVGSNYLGCATLVTSAGIFTTRISVGSFSGTVATEGRMVEWDDASNPNYLTATGQLFMQSVPASMPTGKYTYALGGVYGSSHEYRAGVVGVVALQAGSSGGTIAGGEYDINVEGNINDGNGTATPYSGMTGSYTALDPTTGRFTDTGTIGSATDHHVAYALSSSQYLQMSTDALSENTAILIGKAQAHSGDQTLPVGTNLVYYATATSSAEIGIINITNTTSYSATYYEDVSGTAEPTQNPTCTLTIDTYARVTTGGAICTMYLTNYSKMYPPVFYFYDSSYGVMLGTGAGVYIGSVEPQTAPSGGFSPGSLAGTYYAGDNEVVNEGVSAEMIGVQALTFDGAGNVNIVGDYIGGYIGNSVSQETDQAQTVSLGTMNANGTFNTNSAYGQINAIMISPTKVVNIDNATQPDPIIQIIKPVSAEI